ncbi:ABC transporter permease [Sphingobacterium sp. ML3W]|uniref:ABC transporter permease n=1 Tax=Sphingobacterium sp. ML3W TaxID=1538644 RepID=UPI00249BF620|nr:ABC transporter permease [Sphingobacterium sp. ML3W]WFA77536.1 ABC transporter permease [Sphingobacterium sp. ML3W]
MIGNSLKIAWRNMAKNKLYSFIKIGGFAFGIAICILIVLYIKQETSYNKFYPAMDRIYRLVVQLPIEGKIQRWVSLSAPVAPTLKAEIPAIEQTGRILPNPLFGAGSNQLSLNDNPQSFYDDGFVYVDQSILDMFPTPMISGRLAHALDQPNTLVITKSKAEKYFKTDPIGQTIYLNNNKSKLYTITGVIEDIPQNSTLAGYSFFISLAGEPFYPGEQNQWLSNNYTVYVKLKPQANIEQTEKEILKNYKEHYLPEYKKSGRKLNPLFEQVKINLQNALDIHLKSADIEDDKVSTLNRGDIRLVWTFATVALFILLIACINFINLSTANAATRAKEIGIRKTIGSTRTSLIGQFLLEAICYSVLSLFIGLLLSWFLLPIFNNLANKSLTIPWTSIYFFPSLLVAIIFIGSLAGIYPALYLSRFKPIAALKNKTTGAKSSLFRNGLVIFQFATSIILIVSALVTNQQIRYILEKDLGFKKEQVIVLRGVGTLGNQIPSLKNELKSIPNVSSVSLGDFLPVPIDGAKRNGNPFWNEGRREVDMATQGQFWEIDQDYLSTFGLQLTKGRNFDPKMATDSTAAIINQKLADDLGLKNPIGAKITNGNTWTVVGVVDNFIFESLKGKGYAGLCMVLRGYPSLLSIKVKPENLQQTLNGINTVWNKFSPNQKINYSFLDEGFASLYQDVERTKNIFSCFAIVAIFVAALGLFGLATYVTQQRTKEIGVRKVLGASTLRLLKLLSGDFIKLVFVALVIASPVAWWAMNQWLRDFNYKIDINWIYFILAGMGAVLIALGTISYQTWKAIRTNPVDSLRDE